jgi:phage terminase large subunit-like protein
MRWEEYASGSRIDHFAWWCETFLVQSVDQFAGEPLVLEPWQIEFMGEALATSDPTGATPSWGSVTLVVSRKNGKTSMLAAYALYRLLMDETQPEILLAAASDKQAGRLFDSIVSYIRRNPELAASSCCANTLARSLELMVAGRSCGWRLIRIRCMVSRRRWLSLTSCTPGRSRRSGRLGRR